MASNDYRQVTTVLQRLGQYLNPVGLIAGLADTVREVSVPPPGDPDALDALAHAYRAAADAITVAQQPFRDAAEALTELAAAIREQQRRHKELRATLSVVDVDTVRALVAVYTDYLDATDRAASRFADLAGRCRVAAGVAGGLTPAEAITLAAQCVSVLGDDYDDGILTVAQLRAAGRRRAALSDTERAAFTALLEQAGSEHERAWLYKAVTAGHGLDELDGFAATIRGRDAGWLDGQLSLIDRGGTGNQTRLGVDVRQYEDTTCGTTCLIVTHAEADPLYALSLTSGDFAARFKAERDRVHDETNLIWPEAFGTSPMGMAGYLTARSAVLGTKYGWHLVDDTDHREISATMREVLTGADRGHPVPMLVGGPLPRHYVLVVGHSAGDVLLYEPTGGDTVRVAERDFLNGTLRESAGFDHVQAVVIPT
jgi:hypothetical protein